MRTMSPLDLLHCPLFNRRCGSGSFRECPLLELFRAEWREKLCSGGEEMAIKRQTLVIPSSQVKGGCDSEKNV